jgi:hypothetical protein
MGESRRALDYESLRARREARRDKKEQCNNTNLGLPTHGVEIP